MDSLIIPRPKYSSCNDYFLRKQRTHLPEKKGALGPSKDPKALKIAKILKVSIPHGHFFGSGRFQYQPEAVFFDLTPS
jgi:hypothetical protein